MGTSRQARELKNGMRVFVPWKCAYMKVVWVDDINGQCILSDNQWYTIADLEIHYHEPRLEVNNGFPTVSTESLRTARDYLTLVLHNREKHAAPEPQPLPQNV